MRRRASRRHARRRPETCTSRAAPAGCNRRHRYCNRWERTPRQIREDRVSDTPVEGREKEMQFAAEHQYDARQSDAERQALYVDRRVKETPFVRLGTLTDQSKAPNAAREQDESRDGPEAGGEQRRGQENQHRGEYQNGSVVKREAGGSRIARRRGRNRGQAESPRASRWGDWREMTRLRGNAEPRTAVTSPPLELQREGRAANRSPRPRADALGLRVARHTAILRSPRQKLSASRS